MNITVVKNSTTITIIDDWVYRLRRDGGLNTAEIHFYYSSSDLLDRWDRITFNGQAWRVAEQPTVKINIKVSADWLYTVTLIEPVAILKGVPMPNITYTQNLAKTRTIEDAIEAALLKQSTRLWSEAPKYRLATTSGLTAADEAKLAPNDKLEGKNLYEILAYYGEYVDARPVLDESTNRISFIYFNDDNGTTRSPAFTSIEKSKSIEEFASDIIEDVENVYIESPLKSNYPHRLAKTFYIPADLSDNMSFTNMKLELPFKIKKVTEMVMDVGTSGVIVLRSEPLLPLIPDKYIYEAKEWETLPKSSFWSWIQFTDWGQIRENCLYYEYGGNEIKNLSALSYHATQAGYAGAGAHDITVRVVYEALPDIQLKESTDTLLDGDITYVERVQQQASTVDVSAEKIRLENSLRNMQSSFYNVLYLSTTLQDIKTKIYCDGQFCLITNMTAKWLGDAYEINARLATEYNRKNSLTKPINENRIFEIPKTQMTTRKVIQELEAKIGMVIDTALSSFTGIWCNYNHNLLFGFQGDSTVLTSMYKIDPLMIFAEFEYLESQTYVSVALPYTTVLNGDVLTVVARMTSNTSCDWQRHIDTTIPTNYTAASAIVTDKNGENKTVKLKYIAVADEDIIVHNDGSDIPFIDMFPFVSSEFYDNGTMVSPITKKYDFEIHDRVGVWKDARELLQFETRIRLLANNVELYSENIFKYSMLNDITRIPQLEIIIDGTAYTINVSGDIMFYDSYIKINFTYPATGTLQYINVMNNGNYLIKKEANKAVTNGASGFVNIFIEE